MRNKRQKFVAIAERRVNKAIDQLRLIGNLSNRSNYDYSKADVQKIVDVLDDELKRLRTRFTAGNPGKGAPFKL